MKRYHSQIPNVGSRNAEEEYWQLPNERDNGYHFRWCMKFTLWRLGFRKTKPIVVGM